MEIRRVVSPSFNRRAAPIDSRGLFLSTMFKAMHAAVEPVVADIRNSSRYEAIASGYYIEYFLSGDSVQARVGNSDPYWIYQEKNTDPHMPPWGPGTRLAEWATINNNEGELDSGYRVARAIYRRGTFGNYQFADIWSYASFYIDSQLGEAAHLFIRQALGFSE